MYSRFFLVIYFRWKSDQDFMWKFIVRFRYYRRAFFWKIRLTGTAEYRAETVQHILYILNYLIYFTLTIGIDIGIKNEQGETVLDVLCSHPSQMSQEITALIYGNIIIVYKRKLIKWVWSDWWIYSLKC